MTNDDKNNTTDITPDHSEATAAKSELELAIEESAKWKSDFLYLKAEFENYKRNALKERSELLKFGAERMARDLLDVMDNFERAMQVHLSVETIPNYRTGIELTAKELKDVLLKHGIQEVPSEGQLFNPSIHEALSSEPTTSVPSGHISKVFKKPYKFHDKVIRTGQVVVATAPKTEA
ncbi:MAG: nucleotide exchange factor GrpE [Bdellovibrionales bacterium RIFCSPHIGHO2_01_FULL_40_29]|nr:MAG: nucleotide exchange factor GrpE [Bdellovibrionales bacterium RIFCSPHIGHO2_01_FULL_40_29]OFZ34710.1 MAG: nucleotide exchange factor GrpE [Bdellovibrionales bacterium RIFCSPHIGHO2_02_FULL_40_15]